MSGGRGCSDLEASVRSKTFAEHSQHFGSAANKNTAAKKKKKKTALRGHQVHCVYYC